MALDPSPWSGLHLDVLVDEGNRNEVWQGTINGGRVAVRRSRRSTASFEWELDLVAHLARLGFWVPEIVPADDGSRHVGGIVVQRWLEGERPASSKDWELVGAELQRLHQVTAHYLQRPGCCSVAELAERRQSVDADLDAMSADHAELVSSVFATFAAEPTSVIHGDVDGSNIRVAGDRVGLLDWDESRVDLPWHDLSALAVPLLEPCDHHRANVLSDAWEATNGWVVEPDYARRRLLKLKESLHPPILLLHGLAGHGGEWNSVIEQLPDLHEIAAPDLRSDGTSDQVLADLVAVLKEAGGGPAIVVGQSMGGVIATRLAAERPELVRAVVLIEAGMEPLAEPSFAGLQRWVESWPRSFANRDEAATFFGPDERSTPAWIDGLIDDGDRLVPRFDSKELLAQARSTLSDDRWSEWSSIEQPAIVINAADGTLGDSDLEEMARIHPEVEIVTIADAGHDVHLDQPNEVAAVIGRFMQRLGCDVA